MTNIIIFLVRAGRIDKVSYGHLFRCIKICEEIKKVNKIRPLFIINKNSYSKKILDRKKFQSIQLAKFSKQNILSKLKTIKAQKIIIDTYDFADNKFIQSLKKLNFQTILIDDLPQKKISADIIYNYTIINKIKKKYYNYKKLFFGTNFFLPVSFKKINKSKMKGILIFFGGSDVNNYSEKILKYLIKLNLKIDVKLILGPGYKNSNYIKIKKINKSKFKIVKNVKNLEKEILNYKLVIISAGYTMYKSLFLNKICLIIPTSSHEKIIARNIKKMKLGFVSNINFKDFKKNFKNALENKFLIKNTKKKILKYFKKNYFHKFISSI